MAQWLYGACRLLTNLDNTPPVEQLEAVPQVIADTAPIVGPRQVLYRNAGFLIPKYRAAGGRKLTEAINDAVRLVCRWRQTPARRRPAARPRGPASPRPVLPRRFRDGDACRLLWETFVSGEHKEAERTHIGDARAVVRRRSHPSDAAPQPRKLMGPA